MHRYYCEHSPAVDGTVAIDGSEAHHLLRVMRTTVGQQITLFDGFGAEFIAEVCETSRRTVTVRIVERTEINRELGFELIVGCALPKGDRQRFLIEKLVELGVTRFVPLRTHRSVVKPIESVCQKLRKAVIEASKQCGRNQLLQVDNGCALAEFLVRDFVSGDDVNPPDRASEHGRGAGQSSSAIGHVTYPRHDSTGDWARRGGFDDEEISLALAHCWQPISLGPRILRIETAAVALAAQFAV